VIVSDDQKDGKWFDTPIFGIASLVVKFVLNVDEHYGPYPTFAAAQAKLEQAGWTSSRNVDAAHQFQAADVNWLYFANSGCIDARRPPFNRSQDYK
jgi:hypothetical protein